MGFVHKKYASCISRVEKGRSNSYVKSKGESMYVHIDNVWRLTPSVIWRSLTGESMQITWPFNYERRLSDTEILWQVKVCTYRSHLTTNFICQTLIAPYRCKYTLVEAIWRLTTSVSHWEHPCPLSVDNSPSSITHCYSNAVSPYSVLNISCSDNE